MDDFHKIQVRPVDTSIFYANALAEIHRQCFFTPWTPLEINKLLVLPAVFGFSAKLGNYFLNNDENSMGLENQENKSDFSGFALCSTASEQIEILSICVLPKSRRKSLATNLMKKTIVVKVGGSTLGFEDTTLSDVVKLQSKGYFPIIVHGGGADISEWMKKVGKRPKFVDGRRVTDKETLNIVISVLAGKVNTEMVNQLNIMLKI